MSLATLFTAAYLKSVLDYYQERGFTVPSSFPKREDNFALFMDKEKIVYLYYQDEMELQPFLDYIVKIF